MKYDIHENSKQLAEKLSNLTDKIVMERRETISEALNNAKLEVGKWQEVDNVVCVFSDLMNSTQISLDKQKKTVAKILENLIVPLQDIHRAFGCEFIDIKGDGGIFLYSGEGAEVRSFLASVTANTFFMQEANNLESNYDIKFRVYSGIHKGNILLKRVGARKDNFPVWAGDTVNIAALITKELKKNIKQEDFYIGVTKEIYTKFDTNELRKYLILSCGCNSESKTLLWYHRTFTGGKGRRYYYMHTNWCPSHGQSYLNSVLEIIS